jgi:hypothetical protein
MQSVTQYCCSLIIATAAVGACFGVPKDLQGNIPVKVVNDTGRLVTWFRIVPDGARERGQNWLGLMPLEVGASLELKLKPGKYTVDLDTSELEGTLPAKIDRPVEIHLSDRKRTASARPGYEVAMLVFRKKPPPRHVPRGDAQQPAKSDAPAQCDESSRSCTGDGFKECYGKSCCTLGAGYMRGGELVCGP